MSSTDREFEIREGRPGEGETVLPCYEWLFAPPGGEPPMWEPQEAVLRLEKLLASEEATVLLAVPTSPSEGEGSPVGICTVYIDIESVRYGLRAWIEDLAVAPDVRSGGIGAELMRTARKWARERGATHLELDSGIRRRDAHRFYERLNPSWTGMQYAWRL